MGPDAAVGRDYLSLELFTAMEAFEGDFKQHSAALKFFRKRCERERNNEGLVLSNSHKAAVAAIVHPRGMEYCFEEADMRVWSWWELVAQLDEDSLR